MDKEELIKALKMMPSKTVFVRTQDGAKQILSIELCECGEEILIYLEDH